MAASKGSGQKPIHIKKSHQGALRAQTGTPKGQTIPTGELQALAKSGNPATRKRAQFALNARQWDHSKPTAAKKAASKKGNK